ncbi:MAG: MoaD/ThiS family protein [Flavobacteriales bacterium]
MKLKILYFGMIADSVEKESEEYSFDEGETVKELREHLESRYEGLNERSFRIALNKNLVQKEDTPLKDNAEIALLPAFAGG